MVFLYEGFGSGYVLFNPPASRSYINGAVLLFIHTAKTWYRMLIIEFMSLSDIAAYPLTRQVLLLVCSISTLLPTWLYILAFVLASIGKWLGKGSLSALEFVGRGGKHRYTIVFSILSIVIVIGGVIIDLSNTLTAPISDG